MKQNIRTAMARSAPAGQEPKWDYLLSELWSVISPPLTPDAEQFLLEILAFEGKLQLDETSEMPHRLSPESMLKSLAVQALAKWTGVKYVPEMLILEAADSAGLASDIRAVIRRVTA